MFLPIPQRVGGLLLFRPTFKLSRSSLVWIPHIHAIQESEDPSTSYTRILQCHASSREVEQIHARIIIEGSSWDSFYATHLVKSYAKAGNLHAAHLVFELVPKKTVFLWNAMIRAFSQSQSWSKIAQLYRRMEEERLDPDGYTLPFVIKAFSALFCVEEGKRIHSLACRAGLVNNVYVATALIEMYVTFDEIGNARLVFDRMLERDVVAWTSMISGYIDCGNHRESLRLFREMRLGTEKPNRVTILTLIPACDSWIHAFVIKSGLGFSPEVETAILDMYAKGGDVAAARSLFDNMAEKSLVSWTAMLSGYSRNGYAHEALLLFCEMLKAADVKPDAIVATSVLQACAQLGYLRCGEIIHGYIIRVGPQPQLLAETGLIDMYAKCGNIKAAQVIFDGIQDPNMIAWSALIAGYGHHGLGSKALNLFEKMKRQGFVPDETAFLSILSACSHSGLVREGKECFDSMLREWNMMPNTKHYACMVDLLGRAGLLDEAWNLIKRMEISPDTNVWGALLSACRVQGNVEAAEFACRKLIELEPYDKDYILLLANVYAGNQRWDELSKVKSVLWKEEKRTPGCSFIEVTCKSRGDLPD
ncbi:PREDICTED: pentatricopeptide repeat-containing protein At3g12770-like [Nelumbo nucifera]|uniref:Pentatricopeptide repeat-containing protein At3g12770-like n=2 Tax=Nelumbo nucifera TaxID=4432 RepID=A0A1U7ZBC6_NELNU|nr:PREDICTED: pentatricopeptide repeat-containing protein At3g12770-like [Nelumbo nucifera]DAD48244.1 TPA_asm: hypothetical protein HUJ06_018181 [Nelumbo nucifera]